MTADTNKYVRHIHNSQCQMQVFRGIVVYAILFDGGNILELLLLVTFVLEIVVLCIVHCQ